MVKDIPLGKFFGYDMVLKDVPEELWVSVEKKANKRLEDMSNALKKITFS